MYKSLAIRIYLYSIIWKSEKKYSANYCIHNFWIMSKYNHLSFPNKVVFSPKQHKQPNKKLNYLETLIFSTIYFFSFYFTTALFVLFRDQLPQVGNYHRIAGVGKDLKRSLSSTSLPKHVPYGRLHKWTSNQIWNISIGGDSATSLDNLFQCSITHIYIWGVQWATFSENWQCSITLWMLGALFSISCLKNKNKKK